MPTKRSSRPEPAAISVIDSVDVLEAKIVCGGQTFVELAAQRVLGFQILEHRFDHDVALRELGDVGRAGKTRHDRVDLLWVSFPRSTDFAKKPFGLLARALERVGARVVDDRPESGARRDDRDARAHRAAAGDALQF